MRRTGYRRGVHFFIVSMAIRAVQTHWPVATSEFVGNDVGNRQLTIDLRVLLPT